MGGENKMRHIRNKFGDIIYCIRDDGTITDKFDCDVVGHLKGDRITDKFDIDTLYRIRQDGTITDKYDCDIIGHIREDGSITDKYDIDKHGRIDNSSSGSSDTGCLGAVFALLWGIISFVFVVIIPFLFVYYIIPLYLGLSWVGILSVFLAICCGSIGLIPITFIFAFITVIIECAFWPYYIIAVIIKIKTRCSKKEFLKLFWKWFLKGPVAYVDLVNLLNETNTLPRVAKFYSKRIEFFKKIFKKK